MTPKTIELYKRDRRFKNGERLIDKVDCVNRTEYNAVLEYAMNAEEVRYEVHDTFVTKRNLVTGQDYQERYDTPFYCSPSSETYWSA